MNFFVIGKDKRSMELKKMCELERNIANNINNADAVISSIPFSKDNKYLTSTDILVEDYIKMYKDKILFTGSISQRIRFEMNKYGLRFYDVMELEEVAILNAIPTAEGAIQKAMGNTDISICGSNVLVLGYGRIGKVLSKMLHGIGANVFCEARNEKDLALIKTMGYNEIDLKELDNYLSQFDVIFNTIPQMVLNAERLNKIKKTCVIIDLASNPGGTDFEYAEKIGIKAYLELALPSKVAPKSAAKYVKEAIDKIVTNEKIGG